MLLLTCRSDGSDKPTVADEKSMHSIYEKSRPRRTCVVDSIYKANTGIPTEVRDTKSTFKRAGRCANDGERLVVARDLKR
jgi:hypothetical protein